MYTHSKSRCVQVIVWLAIVALVFPLASASAERHCHKNGAITVMTRNLYLGADIFRVVEAAFIEDEDGNLVPNEDPTAIPFAVAKVFDIMNRTNFPERAEAIADEILAARPDVVGLQEVSTWYLQHPSEDSPADEDDLYLDFYATLNAALKARGLHYKAFFVTNADIEMPMLNEDYSLSDVRLVDHDVILVRKGLKARFAFANNYLYNLSMELGGADIEFTRGYLAVDVNIKGDAYRVVNTHLEVRSSPESEFRIIQAFQMNELLTLLEGEKRPVILLGDFNSSIEDQPFQSDPYGLIVPPYWQAVYSEYADAWLLQDIYDEGYTSGFDETVSNPNAELTTRIDLVFLKAYRLRVKHVLAEVVGNEIEDMTESKLWPSDHAGVVAKIKFCNPNISPRPPFKGHSFGGMDWPFSP